MRKIRIMFLCLITTMVFGACIKPGNCPSDWIYCLPFGACTNGRIVSTCSNASGTSQGYRVGNNCYPCAGNDCDAAIAAGQCDCYGGSYCGYTADSNVPLQEQEEAIDQNNDSENPDAALINEKLIEMKEKFESFKK